MCGTDIGPIQDLLRQPVVARQRTSGLLSCGDLGHVDKGRNTRGPRRDGHIRGSFEEPVSLRRVAEVHPLDVTHRGANRLKIKEVADNHVSAKYSQSLGSIIKLSVCFPNRVALFTGSVFSEG